MLTSNRIWLKDAVSKIDTKTQMAKLAMLYYVCYN